ncbi:uncharacterized protein topaz1 isoform X1 [Anabas testudineus]|uniref:uncharacterized protein topaz1 isoform X1 n=1 Tax=Anabas testudineus TaxID=64144 RepID=UPI000E45658D|nr:uncharacterized protein topaz1 isoform X1 [Anabas testudineus]
MVCVLIVIMFPSSSRVKLNRVALKDAVRLKPIHRRRQVSEPPTNEDRKQDLSEVVSVRDEPVQSFLKEQMNPEKVTIHTTCNTPEGEPGSCVGRAKRKRSDQSCKDFHQEGPYTRDSTHAHSSSTGFAGSRGSLRTDVGASCYSQSGDCKYISLHKNTLGKLRQNISSRGPEQSVLDYKLKTETPVTKAYNRNVLWIDQYPEVTLCDVAQYYDVCCHNCSFVLPNALETKDVRCFKQDMRAGFRFWPSCLGHDKRKREECALVSNGELMPRVQSEERSSQSLSKPQRQMKEHPNAETFCCRTICNFLKDWTTEASATSSASFLVGNCTIKEEYRTSVCDRDGKEEPGPGAEIHTDKRIRLGGTITGSLPTQNSESINYNKTAETGLIDKEQMYNCRQLYVKLKSGSCSSFGSAMREDCVNKQPCGHSDEPRRTDAAQMVSEMLSEGNEQGTDEPESFTCQRVRPYFRKIKFSCARTYMPWPFSNSSYSLTANATTTACPADSSPVNRSSTLNNQTNAATKLSSNTTNQAFEQSEEKQKENGESFLNKGNGKRDDHMFSCSPDSTKSEESQPSRLSDMAVLCTSRQCGSEPHSAKVSASFIPLNEPETSCSMSTPSPSSLGLSGWENATILSPTLSPFTHSGSSSLSTTSASLLPPWFPPCESSLILPQDEKETHPPKLDLYYNTRPINHEQNIPTDRCVEANSDAFLLLPLLSPVPSPKHSWTNSIPQSQDCSEEDEVNKDLTKHDMLPEHNMTQISSESFQSCEEYGYCNEELDGMSSEYKTLSTLSSVGDMSESNEEESQEETYYEDDVEHGNCSSDQVPINSKVKTTPTSGGLTEPCSPPSSDKDDGGVFSDEGQTCFAKEEGLNQSETTYHEKDTAETASDTRPSVLDEFTAYEHDILLVDVIQDDPELFENLPEQGLLRLGPTRVSEIPKPSGVLKTLSSKVDGASKESERRLTPVNVDFHWSSRDVTEERDSRPWRPQCSKTPNTRLATDKQTRNLSQLDANNNYVSSGMERSQPIPTVNSSHNIPPPPFTTVKNGPRITSLANVTEFRRQKSNSYCRQYFSESLSCGFKMCRFQHVPADGDEKFCVETVMRFAKNPMCLQKAGAVFRGYYQNNPPGVYFSVPVLLSLLWALLKATMVPDVFSVLNVSLAHKIVPSHEFLLALFNFVREKGLIGFVPELMQLMFKMASAGLVLSLDCFDCVKNTPEFQHTIHPTSPVPVLSCSAPLPEYLNLAYSIVELELCTKQEDWRRMGGVFRSICKFSKHPNQVEQISGRIAIALLSDSKDKLSLPFAAFADTVCQSDSEDDLIRSFLGRIGVSLMVRYHKTHQWAKGRRVVEVLSMSKVSYSTLKGLFGNEDGASRCCLVTVAAELFLLSGSVEGALNTLRENNWFLSSCTWPCEPADLERRTSVLMRLAEKASHRDTLEVLCNLPGIKEPNNMIDVSRYSPMFNSHLQACVDRQILPVASDTVDFMLSKNLDVDHRVLQVLLQKLGKQNLWLRAREVFRHSLSVGYYKDVSAPVGFMSLIVPCHLGEVELALTFEMFITVNATFILQLPESSTSSLNITLKRTQSCESEYLSAGSRLLSAACIPQPKLTVRYTAVNASQDQVFTLDLSSARRWLRHNHLWANEVWM